MSINRNRKEAARFIDGRTKVGSAAVARVETCSLTWNCPWCFPHGTETRNHRTRHTGKKRDWSRTPPVRDLAPDNSPVLGETYTNPDDRWTTMNPEFSGEAQRQTMVERQEMKNMVAEWRNEAKFLQSLAADAEYEAIRYKYPEAFFVDGQVQVLYMGINTTMFDIEKIADMVRRVDWAKAQMDIKKTSHLFEDQVQEYLHLGAGKYVSL